MTPHDSPHVANEHVPLVFSHPKLPPIEVDLPVQSTQILPTILDLLTETPSLNENARSIVKDDLLPMYQGQSMLRYLIPEHKRTQEWHFTTLNTGGMYLALRSATKSYRVVIPLIPNAKWRFTDIETDPFERQAIKDFDILSLVNIVQSQHGTEAAEWLNEAVHIAQWWIEDNHRRWNYDPNAPKNP